MPTTLEFYRAGMRLWLDLTPGHFGSFRFRMKGSNVSKMYDAIVAELPEVDRISFGCDKVEARTVVPDDLDFVSFQDRVDRVREKLREISSGIEKGSPP